MIKEIDLCQKKYISIFLFVKNFIVHCKCIISAKNVTLYNIRYHITVINLFLFFFPINRKQDISFVNFS